MSRIFSDRSRLRARQSSQFFFRALRHASQARRRKQASSQQVSSAGLARQSSGSSCRHIIGQVSRSLIDTTMLALKKKRENERKEKEEDAKIVAAGGTVSLFGIGGERKNKKGQPPGTKKSPGEIRIQKGNFSIPTKLIFLGRTTRVCNNEVQVSQISLLLFLRHRRT
jgi:hypothetical protein